MDATKVNSFVASIVPPQGSDALSRYFDAVLKALALRSNAELSGRLGVAAATLASWKSRGTVPQANMPWFTDVFPIEVFSAWRDRFPVGGDLPLACVIELLRQTECDPIAIIENANVVTAHAVGGLTAMAGFLLHAQPHLHSEADDIVARVVTVQLSECIDIYRDALKRLL